MDRVRIARINLLPMGKGLTCALILLISPFALGRHKKPENPCDMPREIVSQPTLSKESRKKAQEIHIRRIEGTVNISISEEGNVVESNVVRASSPEAVPFLLEQANSMKFKPRAGCGTTRTAANFALTGP